MCLIYVQISQRSAAAISAGSACATAQPETGRNGRRKSGFSPYIYTIGITARSILEIF